MKYLTHKICVFIFQMRKLCVKALLRGITGGESDKNFLDEIFINYKLINECNISPINIPVLGFLFLSEFDKF